MKDASGLTIHEKGKRTDEKQELHTMDAVKLLEYDLKQTLLGLAFKLFGKSRLLINKETFHVYNCIYVIETAHLYCGSSRSFGGIPRSNNTNQECFLPT